MAINQSFSNILLENLDNEIQLNLIWLLPQIKQQKQLPYWGTQNLPSVICQLLFQKGSQIIYNSKFEFCKQN